MTIPARPLRALQHLNDELMHASEALVCSAHIPQARPRPGTEPADKAA
jgi:hypothetical protein